MMHDAVAPMVQADPEAFGLDEHDAPRLGCATTGHLLTELDARIGDTHYEGEGVLRRDTIQMLRNSLTGEQLAYRTID